MNLADQVLTNSTTTNFKDMIKDSNQSLLIDPIKRRRVFFPVIYICILISREGELVGPIQPLLVQYIQSLLVQYLWVNVEFVTFSAFAY